jgi:REP element-mobilizing transposase RayT
MGFAGTCYHVTRVCSERRFLLRPSPVVNAVVVYCVFFAAALYGVSIHSLSVQSNHMHLVVTDHFNNISRFMHWIDGMIAKNLLVHYRREYPDTNVESVWSSADKFNAVTLTTPEEVMDAVAYGVTQSVKDGLVPNFRKWPGIVSRPGHWMQPKRFAPRPTGLYFNERDDDRAVATCQYTIPPMLADRDPVQLIDDVNALIADKVKAAHDAMRRDDRTFLGVKGALATHPFDSPRTPLIKGTRAPTIAAGGNTTMLKAAITLLRSFRARYREAYRDFCAGIPTIFPAGTCLMQQRYDVPCESLHPPWCVGFA